MFENGLYLYTIVPQWGIFLGILFVVLGVAEKKAGLTLSGWIILMVIGIYTLALNFSGVPEIHPASTEGINPDVSLKALGWQTSIGSILAAFTLLLKYLKSKRYTVLGILTVAFFVIIFFQYYYLTKSLHPKTPATEHVANY